MIAVETQDFASLSMYAADVIAGTQDIAFLPTYAVVIIAETQNLASLQHTKNPI